LSQCIDVYVLVFHVGFTDGVDPLWLENMYVRSFLCCVLALGSIDVPYDQVCHVGGQVETMDSTHALCEIIQLVLSRDWISTTRTGLVLRLLTLSSCGNDVLQRTTPRSRLLLPSSASSGMTAHTLLSIRLCCFCFVFLGWTRICPRRSRFHVSKAETQFNPASSRNSRRGCGIGGLIRQRNISTDPSFPSFLPC